MHWLSLSRLLPSANYYEGARVFLVGLWRNRATRNLLAGALLFNIAVWGAGIFVNIRLAGEVIALHHNVYFGITLIGSPRQLYVVPLAGLFIIAVNTALAGMVQRGDDFFTRLFIAVSLVVQFFLLLGVGSVMLINFR